MTRIARPWMALALTPLLAACSPAQEGTVGLTIDGDGQVIVMLETCRTVAESIQLLKRSRDASYAVVWSEAIEQGHLDAQAYDTGLVLADLARGEYWASAETNDINSVIIGVRVRLSDLASIEPTEVLWRNDYSTEDAGPQVATLEQFAAHAYC